MSTIWLSRMLGWFSLGLGAMEISLPGFLSRQLGLAGGPLLVRAFGVREVAAGLTVLAKPDHTSGPALRVAGDVLDIAVLAYASRPGNPRRGAAQVALVMVLGVTALDVLCTSALAAATTRRLQTARRTRVALSEHPVGAVS